MRDIFFIILLLFLIPFKLNNPEPHKNPRPPACSILDIRPIIWIPVHCHIHWQTQIYPMTTLSIPPQYGLKYEIRRREELCAILIKMSNKFFDKFPPMSLMACTLTSHIWMMAPSNMPPQHIETVPIHACLAKIRSRPVILSRDSRTQACPVSKFETCS